ncbi:MAG: hypothetical protein JNL02_13400 [Saprospiraceae bacterium]|nr:hypothetical protein [Saprospiraceae bacterium]
MSKKRFSEGLDDLFKDQQPAEATAFTSDNTRSGERRHHGKNFMTDLDALLQEALDESLEKFESSQPATPSNKSKSAAGSARSELTGLDALIRQTIDLQELTTDENTGKRRLTVVVDRTKLDKLKTIARLENSYLKDLLVGLIDEYITAYKKDKGLDL